MIPQRFRISGSIGVLSGLGLDDLAIDLSEHVPDEAVTVALVADNGGGKSTIMNLALTPWRVPPMITGTIYDQFGETGLRELEWTHGQETYRSRIEIKNTGKTKSQRAYLHRRNGDQWVPEKLPNNITSDGKSSTYDACLEHILGSQNLYYLAAFRAQGAPKLGEYDDPKQLMEDLLSLGYVKELRDKSKMVIRELNRAHDATREECTALEGQEKEVDELESKIKEREAETQSLVDRNIEAGKAVTVAKIELESATADNAEDEKLRAQRKALGKRLSEEQVRAHSIVKQMQVDIESAARRRHEVEISTHRAEERIRDRITSIEGRKLEAQSLLNDSGKILAAASKVVTISERIGVKEKELLALQKKFETVASFRKEENDARLKLTQTESRGRELSGKCGQLRQSAGYIDIVPCKGQGEYARCPALVDANKALAELPGEEDKLRELRDNWGIIDNALKSVQAEISRLIEDDPQETGIKRTSEELSALRMEKSELEEIANLSGQLKSAEKTAEQANQDITALERDIEETQNHGSRQSQELKVEIDNMKSRLESVRAEHDKIIAQTRRELYNIPNPDKNDSTSTAEQALRIAEQRATTAGANLAGYRAQTESMTAIAKQIRTKLAAAAETVARHTRIGEELARWKLLAISLQGVIDLTIEDAGPSIAETANELLTSAYGPRFSVRIVTQREQANGKLVETFDIYVTDSESGLESPILTKSGGESVWLDKALTDAVSLFHQGASDTHYECMFADESEDGLTAERKQMFYRMDRDALEMGGYERKFFVSHNPEAWAGADAVIRLSDWAANQGSNNE